MQAIPGVTEHELKTIQKPAQYLGGELNSIVKDDASVGLHFCLAFPDTYEVGMSHIGFQIIYDLLNREEHIWAERAYMPLSDMEQLLRTKQLGLFSLESKRALSSFDIVGFSLQYELCSTSIVAMLDLAGIPLLADERDESHPLVIGGGPYSFHPEPVADFFDAFLVGDGEKATLEICELTLTAKQQSWPKQRLLEGLADIQGLYVPSLFEAHYSDTGKFTGVRNLLRGYEKVTKRTQPTLEGAPFPTKPVVPNVKAVHDRLSVEVMRGCVRGCRFCQAGYIYRPQRERAPEEILQIVEDSLKNTGYEELSLLSLSTADYCSILPLLKSILDKEAIDDRLAVSFPSTRVDALKPELLKLVQPVRRAGFTIAPEAGTQRLRDVINKGVTDEELLETCESVFKLGWSNLKMYFMLGLPTETDEDIYGIVEAAKRVKKIAGRKNQVTVSVSTHVPKPHTPFQWAEQISIGETKRRQHILRQGLRKARINFRYHDAFSSFLEGVFARGDRRLSAVILRAYELGARLDGWVESISEEVWTRAFEECGIDPHHYLHERSVDEALPWDHIDCGLTKRYFAKEWQRTLAERTTPDCLTTSCSVCGICDYDAVRNVLFERKRSSERMQIANPPWETETGNVVTDEEAQKALAFKISPQRSDLPDVIQRVRLKYAKRGVARFIGHLELASIFFRATRRAEIPIAFSRGFHPKPKFQFGPPLQLGLESECEFVDLFLTRKLCPQKLANSLSSHLPDGFEIKSANNVALRTRSLQESIAANRYEARLDHTVTDTSLLDSEVQRKICSWREETVQRKKGRKEVQIQLAECLNNVEMRGDIIDFEVLCPTQDRRSVKPLEALAALSGLEGEAFHVRKVSCELCGR